MKKIFYTALCMLFLSSIYAQNIIEVNPDPSDIIENNVDLTDLFLDYKHGTDLTNLTSDSIALKWEIEVISSPAEWSWYICDNNNCYTDVVTTNVGGNLNVPVVLGLQEESFFDVHTRPFGVAGFGEIKVHFYLIEDLNTPIYTASFTTSVNATSSNQLISDTAVKLFPNPSTDWITIEGIDSQDATIEIFDLKGRLLQSQKLERMLFVGDFSSGKYIVHIKDAQATISSNILIIE